jgi:glucan phosphoethanolaminetransferase (alkaline phosphatase superfamily)
MSKIRNLSPEIKSFIGILAGIPFFMGSIYIVFFFLNFLHDVHFVGEHLLTLVFWTVNTALLAAAANRCGRTFSPKTALRLIMLVPALSCFFLFFLYICALIGNFEVGSVITYDSAWMFFCDLFNTSYETGISWFIPVGILVIPLIGFILFYQWKGPKFQQGLKALAEWFHGQSLLYKKRFFLTAPLAWILVAVSLFSYNPHLKFFGHFRFDPVVGFFKNSDFQFSINKERLRVAEQEQIAAQSLPRQTPRARNVILFVVDALRADHLTDYGYPKPDNPYLSTLSGLPYFQKVEWVLSNGSESATGQMSIMSSKEPKDISHLVYSLSDSLSDNDYQAIHFYSGDSVWCNFDKSFGKKLAVFIDGTRHPGPCGINDDRMLVDLTNGLKPDDGGLHFLCYHLMSVHETGYLQDAYLKYQPVINLASYFFHPDSPNFADEKQGAINMYDDRILQCDAIIGQIMEILRQKGYLTDYVGAFTADHGQRLGEAGQFGHGRFVTRPILRVPLLFFGSKPFPPLAQTHFATLWDVAPTLLDLAGLAVPPFWQGQSLLQNRTKFWTYHFSPSTREGNTGAVVYYDQGKILKYSRPLVMKQNLPGLEAVYDLNSDSDEKNDLIQTIDPALLQQMRCQAKDHFVTY